jgi:hypothetical protein
VLVTGLFLALALRPAIAEEGTQILRIAVDNLNVHRVSAAMHGLTQGTHLAWTLPEGTHSFLHRPRYCACARSEYKQTISIYEPVKIDIFRSVCGFHALVHGCCS